MVTPDSSKLESYLRRTIKSLDSAIASVQPLDPKLQRAFKDMYVRRDDELGRLLAEIGHKAGLLDSARVRAEWMARQSSSDGDMVSAAQVEQSHGDLERFTDLDADLPEPETHGEITICVDALAASPARFRLRIHMDYDVSFTAGMPGVEGVSALPLLVGVAVTDQSGAAYPITSVDEANTVGDPVRRLTTALKFARDPVAKPAAITVHFAAVLFADRQTFIATEAAARLVEGPWEFALILRPPSQSKPRKGVAGSRRPSSGQRSRRTAFSAQPP